MKYNKLQKKLINKYQINAFVLQHSAPLIHPYFPMSFNMSAGFIQLEPYIRGKKDLKYTKITTIQKCIRHFDLNKAGRDNTHLTFFDMWGALTLGEMDWFTLLKWNIELLTDDLGIDLDKLTFSVFGGEEIHGQKFEPDTESKQSWLKLGVREDQIHIGDFSNTFWFQGGDDLDDNTKGSPFDSRLCGYQTEIFYDLGGESCGDNCGPFCDCGKWLEISNNLNIQYDYSLKSRKYKKLSTPATETVIGVERVQTVLEGKNNLWDNSLLKPVVDSLEEYSDISLEDKRIIVDRMRALIFLAAEDIPEPDQNGRNRIVRKMIRDVLSSLYLHTQKREELEAILRSLVQIIHNQYIKHYPELEAIEDKLMKVIMDHESVYSETIRHAKASINHSILRGELDEKITDKKAQELRLKLGIPVKLIRKYFG